MNTTHSMMFWEEDSGGGGGATAILGPVGGDDSVNEPTPTEQTPNESTETTPTPAPALDPKALGTEFGAAIREALGNVAAPAKPSEPPMTPEEARKLLNVFEFDDNFIAEFGNIETQKQAFEKLRDGFMRQADTYVQLRVQEAIEQIRNLYDPIVALVQQQSAEQRQQRFAAAYPQLASPKLQPLIQAVVSNYVAQKKTFPDETSMFDAIAKDVEAVIKETNPTFSLSKNVQGSKTKPGQGSSIPITTPGGGGGGGGGSSAEPAAKSHALGILGKVK